MYSKISISLTFIGLLLSIVLADAEPNQQDVGVVIFSDIEAHIDEYVSHAMIGDIQIPDQLLPYYQAIKTFTDDSYSTLLSDFPVSDVMYAVTALPWYSSRLESPISVALTEHLNSTSHIHNSTYTSTNTTTLLGNINLSSNSIITSETQVSSSIASSVNATSTVLNMANNKSLSLCLWSFIGANFLMLFI